MAKKVKAEGSLPGDWKSRLIKDYGEVIMSAEKLPDLEGDIVPTTLSLDIALSGGIPEGTVVSFAGKEKIGKTTTLLSIIRNAQRKYKKKCYYVDVENRLRSDLLKCIKGLVWTEQESQETGIPELTIIRSTKGNLLTGEDYINIILNILKSEEGVIIVMDSIAALVTESDMASKEGESKRMAGIPTLMYSFLRKAAQIVPTNKSILFLVTHLQANPSGYGGPNEFGGNAQRYFSSVRLACLSSPEVEEGGKKVGRDSEIKIMSSSLGPPGGKAIIPIRYGFGISNEDDLINVAEEFGFVNKAGAWYSLEDSKGEEVKLQGRANLAHWLDQNPEEMNRIDTEIRSMIFGENDG